MRYLSSGRLYCFSPPVMIATFIIEISLAIYTVWRYKLNPITRVTTAIFICLAVFQLAEYNICTETWGVDSATWGRIGHVAITFLPPLGIHLVAKLAGEKRRWPYIAAYAFGVLYALYFMLATQGVSAATCLGNYVLFEQGVWSGWPYAIYYYGLLLAAIGYALWLAGSKKVGPPVRKSLHALVMGYLLFMIPTTAVNLVDPSTISGIPSIMCGFAVLLAIVLAFAVLPFAHEKPRKSVSSKQTTKKRK